MERCSTRVLRIGSIPVIVCNEPYGWTEIESDLPEMLVEPQPDFRKFKRRLYKHLRFVRSIAGSLTREQIIAFIKERPSYNCNNVTIKDITTESIVPIDTFLREG